MEIILAILCPLLIGLAFFLVVGIGAMKVFQKAGQPGIIAFVPFYNVFILVTEIAKKDMMWVLLSLFVPFAIIVPLMDVAEKFGKERTYGLGLAFLPFIFFPLLGFGDAKYRGARALDYDDEEEEEEEERPRKKKKSYDDEE